MKPDPMAPGPTGTSVSGIPSRRTRLPVRSIVAMVLLTALMAIAAEPAMAEDKFFGTDSPLLKFVDFMTGPFAYGVVIIALVVTVGALSVGGEFAGFARRMPIVVVAGAIVILASTVIKNLFGADRAAVWPPSSGADASVEPVSSQAHCMPAQVVPAPDALPHCMAPEPLWLIPFGFVLAVMMIGVLGMWCHDVMDNIHDRRRPGRPGDIA